MLLDSLLSLIVHIPLLHCIPSFTLLLWTATCPSTGVALRQGLVALFSGFYSFSTAVMMLTPRLPVELELQVLEIGPLAVGRRSCLRRERSKTLYNLSLVCHRWNTFATRELYKHLTTDCRGSSNKILNAASTVENGRETYNLLSHTSEICAKGFNVWMHETAIGSGLEELLIHCYNVRALVLERISDVKLVSCSKRHRCVSA